MSSTKVTISKLPKSQLEIVGSLDKDVFASFRAQAIKNISNKIKIDGFRKGNIPEKILIAKIGEMPILEEMAELALAKAYPSIVIDEKIDAIGRPAIQITKIATGNPLEFKIVTTVVPQVTLPDYKKLAKEIMSVDRTAPSITDQDVDAAIDRIRKAHVERTHTHDESHEKMSKEDHDKMIADAMPALDDAFVQSVGDFVDVTDFKGKVSKALLEDKHEQEKEKVRIALSDKISDATQVEIPDLLVQSEVRRIEAQFRDDVSRMGVTFDDYLKHAKKSLEEIHAEWKPHAEKKAKLQLVINTIADKENIKVDEKEIEVEVSHIVAHYKDADEDRARIYAESILTNEKVFQFLEKQK